jgi:hypothetical protein
MGSMAEDRDDEDVSMMEGRVRELLENEVTPFRIKLINGDAHDVGSTEEAAVLALGLYIASPDGNWAEFPYTSIVSLESLVVFEG